MGLDFNGSDVHFSYGGFSVFRGKLAKLIDIELEDMAGFGGQKPWPDDDPITLFLHHSDCDGELTPEECASVGPRLLELVQKFDAEDWDKERGIQLAEDMIACGKEGITLEFC